MARGAQEGEGATTEEMPSGEAPEGPGAVGGEIIVYPTLEEYEESTGRSIANYSEAPMLASMVDSGDLPPVEERVSENPIVVDPMNEIGEYGGRLITAANELSNAYDMWWARQFYMFTIGPDMQVFAHVPASYELSDDYKVMTLNLRPGLKWSDGEPFDADDIMFWYNDILLNKELTPTVNSSWAPGGEVVKIRKLDQYTLEFEFAVSYPAIAVQVSTYLTRPMISRPMHYLKKWHISYNEDADDLAAEEGYDSWWQAFSFHGKPKFGQDTDLPMTFPWVLSEVTTTERIYDRNPYYWMVDVEGNQLPYADGMDVRLVQNEEVQNLNIAAGELSYAAHGTALTNYPFYKQNEEEGGYQTRLWQGIEGSNAAVAFNLTSNDEVLREIFNDIRFRQAMSLAIDRDEINELVYFGRAVPRQATVVPASTAYEDWMGEHYATLDVEQANQLLDEMGLEKGSDGFRKRPDGETLTLNLPYVEAGGARDKIPELLKSYWEENVGVKTVVRQVQREFYMTQAEANEFDVGFWGYDRANDLAMYQTNAIRFVPPWGAEFGSGMPWETWYDTNGASGEEPPAEIKELFELRDEWVQYPLGTPESDEVLKQIVTKNVENLYVIGSVGLAPTPVIVRNDVKNVPETALFGEVMRWYSYLPQQWYVKQ
jgi:peptide/nickel transport system substrate-binding protein